MPEGDAVHRTAQALQVLVGERLEAESSHPRGAATGVARAIDGHVLEAVEAIGKNLLLHFEGGLTIRSHLRMSGRWRVQKRGAKVFGRPWLVLRGEEWEAIEWNGPVLGVDTGIRRRIGPDLLDDRVERRDLVRALRRAGPERLLGDVLLDQHVISGVGNMWAAEGLWHARISPWLHVGEASDEELDDLVAWLRAAMARSVAGTRSPRSVYRQPGRSCARCGGRISSHGLGDANRTAYWCPGCQRAPA